MAKPGQPSSNSSDGDRDIARVRTELSNRLESRGVEVFDSDSPLDVVEIMEAVERFERAVESHGGDLMMDKPPERGDSEPDDPHFLVPKRKPHETRIKYVERLAAATAAARKLEK